MTPAPFLTAEWRNLLMLNYEVSRTELAPFVPAGTELDDWQGHVLASLVVFQFLDTRVRGLPVPLHRDFEELNLRFYVRHVVGGEIRRGVVFLREIVPLPLVAIVARVFYNEPYRTRMMHSEVQSGPPPSVRYSWRADGKWHSCSGRGAGAGAIPNPGSLEEFVTEHYWGYGRRRDRHTLEYRVSHPRWTVWPAASFTVEGDLSTLFGPRLGGLLGTPASVFVADGSTVTVSPPALLGGLLA